MSCTIVFTMTISENLLKGIGARIFVSTKVLKVTRPKYGLSCQPNQDSVLVSV